MACRGCANLQCNCFTANSETTNTVGNGAQYAPFTFRPNYIPFPRPFGSMYGLTNQPLDGAAYTQFPSVTPDIDHGGNMITGNGTNLTATAKGIYLVGVQAPFLGVATDNLNDAISIRRNGIQVSTVTFAHSSALTGGPSVIMSTTTLLNLNINDTLDLFVERVAGAGTVSVQFVDFGAFESATPRLWAVWMGVQT